MNRIIPAVLVTLITLLACDKSAPLSPDAFVRPQYVTSENDNPTDEEEQELLSSARISGYSSAAGNNGRVTL
ncbi:MAG: hypothetical protein ACRENP_24770 [Longimicrobiales bacterium]